MHTGRDTGNSPPLRSRALSVAAVVVVAVLAACEPVRPWPVPGPDGRCRIEWGSTPETAPAYVPARQVTFGVGVRARLPFRVMAFDGPGGGSRVVRDVAHRWN